MLCSEKQFFNPLQTPVLPKAVPSRSFASPSLNFPRFPLAICHTWGSAIGFGLQTLGPHTPWICISLSHKYRASLCAAWE